MATKKPQRIPGECEIRHDFTNEEWKQKSQALTRKMRDRDLKVEQIKANASQGKAEVKMMNSEIQETSNDLDNGYTMIKAACWIEYDRKRGKKRFYLNAPGKPDNNKVIRDEPLSDADYKIMDDLDQQQLPGVGDAPAEEKPLQGGEPPVV
jgi:hypothetical protein